MGMYCGIDWAEGHHDVALVDDNGVVRANRRIGTKAEGFSELMKVMIQRQMALDKKMRLATDLAGITESEETAAAKSGAC